MKIWIVVFSFFLFPLFLYSQNEVINGLDLLVKQVGDNNETHIVQISTGAQDFTKVEQYGSYNQTEVIQEGGTTTDKHHSVTIIQDGALNRAFVKQFDEENTAEISQKGGNNLFRLKQSGNQNILGYSGNSFIQDGNSNKLAGIDNKDGLFFNEDGYALQEDGATLDAASFQKGDNNVIGLHQGADDIGLIQQFGNGNETLLWQGGGGNYAKIQQYGSGNSVALLQTK